MQIFTEYHAKSKEGCFPGPYLPPIFSFSFS
jgi:hypothetical protein